MKLRVFFTCFVTYCSQAQVLERVAVKSKGGAYGSHTVKGQWQAPGHRSWGSRPC